VPIWIVGVGDPGAQAAVDAAYRNKYGRYASYVEPMVSAHARQTTLRLIPSCGSQRR
jgi:hypothetical protein